MYLLKRYLLVVALIFPVVLFGQQQALDNWFNLDPASSGIPGMATEKAYQTILKNKTGKKVIVAVLDSGVDGEHEDLKDVMWTNKREIPGNGIDDDQNGYIDDIHGWNFLGGKNGKNITKETLEKTRIFAKYRKQFEGRSESSLTGKEKKDYKQYLDLKKMIESEREKAKAMLEEMESSKFLFESAFDAVIKELGGQPATKANIEALNEKGNLSLTIGKRYILKLIEEGEKMDSLEAIKKIIITEIDHQIDPFRTRFEYEYNPDCNVRREIVGDDPNNSDERNYGNNDTRDWNGHGTHVAGIIAANRTNKKGMEGVAENVEIMAVRCVPDGDERDKDVANAIRYAVDNGASVINMSFGKSYSWDKAAVDKAVQYAREKDVLLIHAAGNDGKNNDKANNFPNDRRSKKCWFGTRHFSNWIEVGALNWAGGEDLSASFSNYGSDQVDVFAPGTDILSTTPNNNYSIFDGTSMASPMVAGVAALIRSYYPELTADQVKESILKSANKQTIKVKRPGDGVKVSFDSLSATGGIINAHDALQYASRLKGKKKQASGSSRQGA